MPRRATGPTPAPVAVTAAAAVAVVRAGRPAGRLAVQVRQVVAVQVRSAEMCVCVCVCVLIQTGLLEGLCPVRVFHMFRVCVPVCVLLRHREFIMCLSRRACWRGCVLFESFICSVCVCLCVCCYATVSSSCAFSGECRVVCCLCGQQVCCGRVCQWGGPRLLHKCGMPICTPPPPPRVLPVTLALACSAGSAGSEDTAPPRALLAFVPLADLTNACLGLLNFLRQCMPVACGPVLVACLARHAAAVVEVLAEVKRSRQGMGGGGGGGSGGLRGAGRVADNAPAKFRAMCEVPACAFWEPPGPFPLPALCACVVDSPAGPVAVLLVLARVCFPCEPRPRPPTTCRT
jgi:hypothetical protein